MAACLVLAGCGSDEEPGDSTQAEERTTATQYGFRSGDGGPVSTHVGRGILAEVDRALVGNADG